MVEILKRLTEAGGASGNEGEVRELIMESVKPHSDSISIDNIGNLIVHKQGKPGSKRVMVCAHMDEVGFIISGIADNGMLRFKPVGGMDPRVLVSKRVHVGSNKVPGVIGIKAIHLQEPEERNNAVKQKQMYIDIGVRSKDDAERLVKPGDYAVFDSRFVLFGDNKVKAKALDDRAGCGIITELVKERFDCDLYACFTVQEEVGLRGAEVAAYHVRPELALVIEGTTCADLPDVPEHLQTTRLGRGPAITFMDHSIIADKALFQNLIHTAEEHGIPYQLKENVSGGNDAGKIHLSRGGVPTVVISVPCRYIHSPSSVMDMEDYHNTLRLAIAFLKGSDSRC